MSKTTSRKITLGDALGIKPKLGVLLTTLLALAASLVVASPAQAAGFTDGDFICDSTSATTATITDYTGGPIVTIPSTVTDGTNTYTVTAIGNQAFQSKGLTSVTIPNTVTYIGQSGFGMNSLTSIVIPDSVTSMGTAAFQWNSLTTATIGTGLSTIPGYTFWGSPLTSISIPNNITQIGEEAFVLSHMASVDIPDSVTEIGNSAFSLSWLTSVTFGSGLQTIGDYAFASSQLSSVVIPSSVSSIGNNAFNTSAGMTSIIFQGAAPTTFTPRSSGSGSLGDHDVTVYYSSSFSSDFNPSPWQGYETVQGVTVSFDLAGHGSAIAPQTVISGQTVSTPAAPTATGYTFDGWFTTASGTTPFDFTAAQTTDATAYAHWTATDLAATGTETTPLLVAGFLLLLIGSGFVFSRRAFSRR